MKTSTLLKALAIAAFCPLFSEAQQTPQLLKDIATQGFFTSSNPSGFQRAGDNVYFFAAANGLYSNLFITDGTETGTEEATIDEFSTSFASLVSIPYSNNMLVANSLGDNVYFSDGTATGEVAIINDFDYAFDYGFNQRNAFTIGSDLFFWAARTADAEGGELYKTDGTAAGTSLFKAFNPGSAKGYAGSTVTQHCINATANKAYIVAYDGDSNNLYVSDGTTAGTNYLQTLTPSFITQDPNFYPAILNGHAYIKTTSKLWSVDVTDNSIDALALPVNIIIIGTYHMNDKLYVITHDGTNNRDLYEVSGTSLTLIYDNFTTGSGGIYPLAYSTSQCQANDKFYFFNHPNSTSPVQLWVSDGTQAGTVKALDSIGVSGNGIDNIYACNNRTYYYQSGAVKTLFEINPNTYALDQIAAIDYTPYMDEEVCRFYFGYTDTVVMLEPFYLDMGAPVNNTLNPPTNLVATTIARSSAQISLTWQDNSSNEDGFYVERGTDGTSFSQIADLGADVTSYDDTTSLAPSTQYFYRVLAYNSTGNSTPSNVANATTNPLSVAEHSTTAVALYPNPAKDNFQIEVEANCNFRMFNIGGIMANSGRLQPGVNTVEASDLPTGLYFIEIQSTTETAMVKILIQ